MSKKYVIDLPDDAQYILINGASENHCYTRVEQVEDLEELNSDYINENYGSMQDEAYRRGLEDAWAAAKRIFGYEMDGGIPIDNVREAFGYVENALFCTADIVRDYTVQEAIDKIKAYDDKHSDRIEVGDEVQRDGHKFIVTKIIDDTWFDGIDANGTPIAVIIANVTKTGKHYDIASILEAMRNDR